MTRVVPKELEEDRIFDLWGKAQSHIWRAWMIETDPANLQPKLRPLNRRAAEFIRANPPPEMDGVRITQALDVLESPGRDAKRSCCANGMRTRREQAQPRPAT